jgi:Asp-tRNA(Asn)/Glu-tRNA(Gln) amidotransferase A subunit family amidase
MQAVSWTLDHAGPMARSVADISALLDAVVGPDTNDPATLSMGSRGHSVSEVDSLVGQTIAIFRDFMGDPVTPDVGAAVETAMKVLGEAGATVREFSLSGFIDETLAAHNPVMWSELAHVHRDWFPSRSDEYTEFSQDRIAAGRLIPAIDYLQGLDERRRIQVRIATAMHDEGIDLLLLPAAPMVATLHEDIYDDVDRVAELMALGTWNSPFNVTGQPSLSIPCGFSAEGLPIGLQIVGRHGEDRLVLQAGKAYQARTGWHRMHPRVPVAS